MKEIFDRRYPVTSFLSLSDGLGISTNVGDHRGKLLQGRYPISIWSHVRACHSPLPEQIWRLFSAILFILGGSISLLICFRSIILVGK